MITLGLDEARRAEPALRSLDYGQFSAMGLLSPPTTSGVTVSQATANTVSAYWNGVCVISGDIGVVGPPDLYRREGDDDREKVLNDPVARVLANPNPQTTAMQFWETITSHAVSWGNGYAEIEFDRALRPMALWVQPPDCMEAKVEPDGKVYYLYRGATRLESWEVFHVPGLGFDGIRGYSPVALARQSLGLSMAAERFGGALFGNGAWPGLVLEHPGKLTPESKERLEAAIARMHTGTEKASRTLVLDQGLKASKPITIPPDDAQFLETRSFQIEEMARWLNMPPHKLKHKVNERPGGNFEASELDYTVTTLMPWARRITDECDRKLIAPTRRARFYTEFNFNKRLKTDTNTRMSSYKSLFDMGVIDADLIARKENLPKPKPEEAPAPAPPKQPPAKPAQMMNGRVVVAQQRALAAVLQHYLRRESEAARRAAKKGPQGFGAWVEEWYGADERALLMAYLEPAMDAAMAALGSDGDAGVVSRQFVAAYLERSKGELLSLKASDIATAVPAMLKRWGERRAAEGVEELMAAMSAEEREHVA